MSGVFVPEEVLFEQEKPVCSIEERILQDKEKQLFLQDSLFQKIKSAFSFLFQSNSIKKAVRPPHLLSFPPKESVRICAVFFR